MSGVVRRGGLPRWAAVTLVMVFIAALIGGVVAWFLYTFEQVEQEVEVGYRGMARVNQYYAAELFLKEMGLPTESRFGLGELPASDEVVVILTTDRDARRGFQGKLYDWVARGGHLIVVAIPEDPPGGEEPTLEDIVSSDQDDLLSMAGLALRRQDSKILPDATTPPDQGDDDDVNDGDLPGGLLGLLRPAVRREVVSVSSPVASGPRLLEAEVEQSWNLVHRDDEGLMDGSFQPEVRPYLPFAYAPVAQGHVTAMVDPYFMTNDALGAHDHARLLYALMAQRGTPAGALLIIRAQGDSLLGVIWRHGWMVLVSLMTLILAWIWMASRRFGPTLPDPLPTRRSLLEHIEAMGLFLWKHGYHEELLKSAREAVRLKLAARLGGETNLEGTALEQAISDETGVRASRVHEAFYGAKPKDRRSFTQAMTELQRLWREK